MKELEGVHKFRYELKKSSPPEKKTVHTLEKWRAIFYKIGFIGEYETDNVGYGNLSMKINSENHFVITGTQTGKYPHLNPSQYTTVTKCDLEKMRVMAKGICPPSSESLTHYALYLANPKIKFVFHIHHEGLWNMFIENKVESTSESVSYGTIEMAEEAKRCVNNKNCGFFVMKGHQDGIMAYGDDENIVGNLLLEQYRNFIASGNRD